MTYEIPPTYQLLIITPAEFQSTLQPLVDHKNATGISTAVLTLSQVSSKYTGRDMPDKVKQAVADYQRRYLVKYVMLVGDSDIFPVRFTYKCEGEDSPYLHSYRSGDLYYADLYEADGITFEDWDGNRDGQYGEQGCDTAHANVDRLDMRPDVALGRVPISNATQLTTFVNKVLQYRREAAGSAWTGRALFITGDYGVHAASGYANEAAAILSGFDVVKLYHDDPGCNSDQIPNPTNINDQLNRGALFATYIGHGARLSWGTGGEGGSCAQVPRTYYDVEDHIVGLHNADALPVLFTFGCETGQFAPPTLGSWRERYSGPTWPVTPSWAMPGAKATALMWLWNRWMTPGCLRTGRNSTSVGVEVRDTLPANATFVSASNGGSFDGNRTVTWYLSQSGSFQFHLTVRVNPNVTDGFQLYNKVELTYRGAVEAQEGEYTTVRRPAPTPTRTPTRTPTWTRTAMDVLATTADGGPPTATPVPSTGIPLSSYEFLQVSTSAHTFLAMLTPTPTQTPTPTTTPTCIPLLRNSGFEGGNLYFWHRGGLPAPVVSDAAAHSGTYSALLSRPPQEDRPGVSWMWQYARIPEEVVSAQLRFWYKVRSEDANAEYDWFVAYVVDSDENSAQQIVRVGTDTDWTQAAYDLSAFAGQTVGVAFRVRNDGQNGHTWAFVDDVTLCVDTGGKPIPTPTPVADFCWKADGYPDYAPHGLPDFDQRQADWTSPGSEAWSYDGPVAVANALWWLDSQLEPGSTLPPDVSDGFPLVEAYGAWDDHDARNLPPLVEDLALRMDTDGQRSGTQYRGTEALGLYQGVRGYLQAKGLFQDFTAELRQSPSFDWVRERVKRDQAVVLLLGFWELQPGGWKRLGGHYVTVAGVSCEGDWIAFSDPFRNTAEVGRPGRSLPHGSHGHTEEYPDTVHHDAAYVSHDVYRVMRTVTGWGPEGYALTGSAIENFFGQNFAQVQESDRAKGYNHGTIVTLADYALVIASSANQVTLRLDPAENRATAGQIFTVDIRLDAGAQTVDEVNAFLDFDPQYLVVVGDDGNPTNQIVPGPVLTATVNSVDNTLGHIDYVATATGGTSGTIRFRARRATEGTEVRFAAFNGQRNSDVRYQGNSVLSELVDGMAVIGPGASIAGSASMEGRPDPPDPSWSVPLLLTLYRPGQVAPSYVTGLLSDEQGQWTAAGVVPPGRYNLRLKGLHTLRNLLPSAPIAAGANTFDMETLLEGDTNNDNRVNARDVSLLSAAFGTHQGETGFDPRTDFNEDSAVDDADQALLQANLGRVGDIVVGGSRSLLTLQVSEQPQSTMFPQQGTVTVSLLPAQSTATVGQVFTVTVWAEAGSQPVDAAEIHVNFDPARLTLVNPDGQPATGIEAGNALGTVLQNNVDNWRGWIDFVAAAIGQSPPSGSFTIATLRFKVVAAGQTTIRFAFDDWRMTDLSYAGESVLGPVHSARVSVHAVYLPVILRNVQP